MKNINASFTLAEVLIVLTIIGIVAAISIPSLINNVENMQYKSAYKKSFSDLSQAFMNANREWATSSITGSGDYSSLGLEANFLAIQEKFKIVKKCGSSELNDCWDTSGEKWRGEETDVLSFVDQSGISWRMRANDTNGKFPIILVDVNGKKKPNIYGKDRFPFLFVTDVAPIINPSNVIFSYKGSVIGTPTRIIPFADVTIYGSDNESICPSIKNNEACNYTSFIQG